MTGFVNGIMISLTVVVPLGPMGMLCIGRTLRRGCFSGIATGLGCSTVHVCYASVLAMGADLVVNFLRTYTAAVRTAGGLILIMFGLSLLARLTTPPAAFGTERSFLRDYFSALGIAFCNPMTLMGFVAGMAAFGATAELDEAQLVSGVLLGSASWYIGICILVAALRRRLSLRSIAVINCAVALLTCAAGIIVVSDVL